MTTLTVPSELDAAEALLELQSDHRKIKYEPSCGKEFKDNPLPIATFLYNLIGARSPLGTVSNNTSTPKPFDSAKPSLPYDSRNDRKHFDVHRTPEAKYKNQGAYNSNVKCKVAKQEAIITKVWSDSFNDKRVKIPIEQKIKHDKATQTEIEYQMPEIEKMENIIRGLCSKIETLENRLKNKKSESSSLIDSMTDINTDNSYDEQSSRADLSNAGKPSHKRKRASTLDTDAGDYYNSSSANNTHYAELSYEETDKEYSNSSNNIKSNHNSKRKSDMVSIGEGHAIVPCKLMKNMDWSSYTNATRKLLTAVFSRKVLATHSLTGKPSPAFPDKPAKKKLNSSLVNDIVQTVVERCRVPENVVRTSITTKCADESKMFRSRQQNKKKRTSTKRNRENVPPAKYESDSDEFYSSS